MAWLSIILKHFTLKWILQKLISQSFQNVKGQNKTTFFPPQIHLLLILDMKKKKRKFLDLMN